MSTVTARRTNSCHIPGNGPFPRKEIILQCALTSLQCRQEPSFKIVIEFEVRPPGANCNQLTRFPAVSAASAGSRLAPRRLTHAVLLNRFPTASALKAGLPLHRCGGVRQNPSVIKDLNFLFIREVGGSLLMVLFPAGGTELRRKIKL